MKINDLVSGIALGSLAVATWLNSSTFPAMPGQNVGPNMFPQLIATGLAICAVFLVVRGFRALATERLVALPEWLGRNRASFGFAAIPAALLFYLAVSEWLGFLLTAALMLFGLFRVFLVRPRTALLVAVPGALAVHALFYTALKVPLPWGVLSGFAW